MKFIEVIAFLRSMCFGGLVGLAAGVALCVYFNQAQHIKYAAVYGALLGAAIHRGVEAVFVRGIFAPIGNFIEYYGKLTQIEVLTRRGIIERDVCEEIKKQMTLAYFKIDAPGVNASAVPTGKNKTPRLPD